MLNTYGSKEDLALGGLADRARFAARLRSSCHLTAALGSLLDSLGRRQQNGGGSKRPARRKRRTSRTSLGAGGGGAGAWKYPRLESSRRDLSAPPPRGPRRRNKNSSPSVSSDCRECSTPVLEHNPGGEISCDLCLRWFHLRCK